METKVRNNTVPPQTNLFDDNEPIMPSASISALMEMLEDRMKGMQQQRPEIFHLGPTYKDYAIIHHELGKLIDVVKKYDNNPLLTLFGDNIENARRIDPEIQTIQQTVYLGNPDSNKIGIFKIYANA